MSQEHHSVPAQFPCCAMLPVTTKPLNCLATNVSLKTFEALSETRGIRRTFFVEQHDVGDARAAPLAQVLLQRSRFQHACS